MIEPWIVIPADAGTQRFEAHSFLAIKKKQDQEHWIPAFSGMTIPESAFR
jgi:hypothetical protein